MQRYTVYLYLETALHLSGGTSTHHQERKQLYLQHLVFVTPLLLSAAIVEELEPVWVCCGWRTRTWYHHPSSGAQKTVSTASGICHTVTATCRDNTRCYRYSCLRSWWWVVVPPETCRAVSRWNKLCNVASCWIYIKIFLWYLESYPVDAFR